MKDGIAVVEGSAPVRSALRGLRRLVMYPFLFVSLNVGMAVVLSLVCVVAMNLLVAPYRSIRGDSVERTRAKTLASSAVSPEEALRQAYPGKTPDDVHRAAREMVSHWRFVRGICREFGITTVFAMQPVPVVDYPLDEHPFLAEADLKWGGRFYHYAPVREGYAYLQESSGLDSVEHLDLSGLNISGSEYVDSCHYTSAFNQVIANKLVEAVLNNMESDLGTRVDRHVMAAQGREE